MIDFPDIMKAKLAEPNPHEQALQYRREQWRHEVALEIAKVFLESDLREGGKVDANTIIETAQQFALTMYPEPR